MYDMLGRQNQVDVRDRSVAALVDRYTASRKQGTLVAMTAERLFDDNHEALRLPKDGKDLLRRAAMLHEIGLAVSHSNYHKHSGYLLLNSDIFGFSQSEQEILSELVVHHRRKLKEESLDHIKKIGGQSLVHLCLMLRLAVLAYQSRSRHSARLDLSVVNGEWRVTVHEGNHRALIISQLENDKSQFAKWGIKLVVKSQDKA